MDKTELHEMITATTITLLKNNVTLLKSKEVVKQQLVRNDIPMDVNIVMLYDELNVQLNRNDNLLNKLKELGLRNLETKSEPTIKKEQATQEEANQATDSNPNGCTPGKCNCNNEIEDALKAAFPGKTIVNLADLFGFKPA